MGVAQIAKQEEQKALKTFTGEKKLKTKKTQVPAETPKLLIGLYDEKLVAN